VRELEQFAEAAARAEQIAVEGLHGPKPVQGRERTFADALLRHAKGAHMAAAAWRFEVGNR
jgi:hypothetical protein